MSMRHSMDLTSGSVTKKLILFAIPILLSNMLQQLYNAADMVVVGQFASPTALGAVGSTTSINTLLLSMFNGLAIGANVVCANCYGARRKSELYKAMYTSLLLALMGGLALAVIGMLVIRPLLRLMGSPENIIDQAALYMRIILCGVPASLLYNFGAGILRAYGDTKRPMYILGICGIINVVLNLVLVICFHMDVAGVAVATVVSQICSAVAVLWILFSKKGEYKLRLKDVRFHGRQLRSIVSIGIPCGVNGMLFSVSNVTLQSSVNAMGAVAVSASAASDSVTNFVFIFLSSFYTACVSFAGQCFGAKRYDRIDKLMVSSILVAQALVAAVSLFATCYPQTLIGLFTNDPEVVRLAAPKLLLVTWSYMLYAIPEMATGCQRGMGNSTWPTICNILCICASRVLWAALVFPRLENDLISLFMCYPVSYILCALLQIASYMRHRRKFSDAPEAVPAAKAQ